MDKNENDPVDEPKKMAPSKNVYLFRGQSKTHNGDQNRIYPSLTLQTAKCFPLKMVLKRVGGGGKQTGEIKQSQNLIKTKTKPGRAGGSAF